jgi:hypothetical protein
MIITFFYIKEKKNVYKRKKNPDGAFLLLSVKANRNDTYLSLSVPVLFSFGMRTLPCFL